MTGRAPPAAKKLLGPSPRGPPRAEGRPRQLCLPSSRVSPESTSLSVLLDRALFPFLLAIGVDAEPGARCEPSGLLGAGFPRGGRWGGGEGARGGGGAPARGRGARGAGRGDAAAGAGAAAAARAGRRGGGRGGPARAGGRRGRGAAPGGGRPGAGRLQAAPPREGGAVRAGQLWELRQHTGACEVEPPPRPVASETAPPPTPLPPPPPSRHTLRLNAAPDAWPPLRRSSSMPAP